MSYTTNTSSAGYVIAELVARHIVDEDCEIGTLDGDALVLMIEDSGNQLRHVFTGDLEDLENMAQSALDAIRDERARVLSAQRRDQRKAHLRANKALDQVAMLRALSKHMETIIYEHGNMAVREATIWRTLLAQSAGLKHARDMGFTHITHSDEIRNSIEILDRFINVFGKGK